MTSNERPLKIFACNGNPELAKAICDGLGHKLGASKVSTFADGEISVETYESVRGADVFIVQPTCNPVNDNLMQLLIMIDAFSRASAGRITAVIPYFGYARQDRKSKSRDPISAKLVADLITTAGADRILTLDLHAAQIQGFFNIPVDVLTGMPIFARYYQHKFSREELDNFIAVSPDIGSVSRARAFAQRLGIPLAIIDKRRQQANHCEVMNIIGDVSKKRVILFDDMVDTGGSLCNGANALIKNGATEVYACASHGVLSGDAIELIEKSAMKEILFLDTIPLPEKAKNGKIGTISVAYIFSEAIERIHEEMSISALFQ